jgi:hypothetical protein
MYAITNSLEWSDVKTKLEAHARTLGPHGIKMLTIVSNISKMVSELSREEINCRRHNRQTMRHRELLDKINQEIDSYEKMITFGTLLGN